VKLETTLILALNGYEWSILAILLHRKGFQNPGDKRVWGPLSCSDYSDKEENS